MRASDFLALAFPVEREEEFFSRLKEIAKEHFDASHHCWAFRLRVANLHRFSDAGEPAGTAGKPILAALERAGLVDSAIVVARWFGGTKLGTGGLARAYHEAAAAAIQSSSVVERYLYARYRLAASYAQAGAVYRLVDPPSIIVIGEEFGERSELTVDVRSSMSDRFEMLLRERRIDFERMPE
ncbi:MAG TPA: YigZ family protein [Thermoanaerobaculia bacterium]|nr:YigZ family protein [Thermoanaerobaculia bacterium]